MSAVESCDLQRLVDMLLGAFALIEEDVPEESSVTAARAVVFEATNLATVLLDRQQQADARARSARAVK